MMDKSRAKWHCFGGPKVKDIREKISAKVNKNHPDIECVLRRKQCLDKKQVFLKFSTFFFRRMMATKPLKLRLKQ